MKYDVVFGERSSKTKLRFSIGDSGMAYISFENEGVDRTLACSNNPNELKLIRDWAELAIDELNEED